MRHLLELWTWLAWRYVGFSKAMSNLSASTTTYWIHLAKPRVPTLSQTVKAPRRIALEIVNHVVANVRNSGAL
jgi:hypothetical protein